MDERKLAEQLQREGFDHTYVWQDGLEAFYPDHTHEAETARHHFSRRDDSHVEPHAANLLRRRTLRRPRRRGALGAHGARKAAATYFASAEGETGGGRRKLMLPHTHLC